MENKNHEEALWGNLEETDGSGCQKHIPNISLRHEITNVEEQNMSFTNENSVAMNSLEPIEHEKCKTRSNNA